MSLININNLFNIQIGDGAVSEARGWWEDTRDSWLSVFDSAGQIGDNDLDY